MSEPLPARALGDPPPWLALTLCALLPPSALPSLFGLSRPWHALAAQELTWHALCRTLSHVSCPPELCGGTPSWRALYPELLARRARLLAGGAPPAAGGARAAAAAAFSSRVVVRFRPAAEAFAAEEGADGAEGAGAVPAQQVHVPLHQRMQILRATAPGASLAAALCKGAPPADPWRLGSVEATTAAAASASAAASDCCAGENAQPPLPAAPLAAPLASPAILPTGPREVLCIAPRVGLRTFAYHEVHAASASQAAVYRSVARGLVYDFLNGTNATIFAFGQTGSGKTYSMDGGRGSLARVLEAAPGSAARSEAAGGACAYGAAGIVPRALGDVLAALRSRRGRCAASRSALRLSAVEVSGARVLDLLAGGREVGPWSAAAAAAVAAGAGAVPLRSAAEAGELLARAGAARATAATALNAHSSRAHTLYILELAQCPEAPAAGPQGAKWTTSKLILADLGGSENIVESGAIHNASRLKEAIAINTSLLALKRCISARLEGGADLLPPFADSRLTQLLQPSLSGAAKIGVLLACRSEPRFVGHSLTALRFGEEAGAMQCKGTSAGGAGGGAAVGGLGAGGAGGVLEALARRLRELEAAIAAGERWEGGRPVGVEGLREEYESLLASQRALSASA